MKTLAIIAVLALGAAAPAVNADVVFVRPPLTTGQLIQSSRVEPDGFDGDAYAYDSFRITGGAAITEVHWRGGYIYNAQYGGHVNGFVITFYESIVNDSQPHCNNPEVEDDIFLAQYDVPNNAAETLFGVVGGRTLYDYHFTLPTPFVAAPGVKYWMKIDGLQPSYSDWGICAGAFENGSYFRYLAGINMFQFVPGDLAFTFMGTPTCAAPDAALQPAAASSCATGSASFTAGFTGTDPMTYRWQRETAPGSGAFVDLADGPTGSWDGGAPGVGGIVSGAATATLTIAADTSAWRRLDAPHSVAYRCRAANSCGSLASAPAPLTVCRADADCSAAVNSSDISAFLAIWLGSLQGGTPAADYNSDGAVNSSDISAFLTAWLAAITTGGC